MLEKVDFPLTNGQISEFVLDKGYTTYFKLQQTLSEMVEARFIREEITHNRTLYHLTEEGASTLQFFGNKISPAIKNDIDAFLTEHKYDLKNEVNLIDLTLTVPSEKEAQAIANNWQQKNEEIYAYIMKNLL